MKKLIGGFIIMAMMSLPAMAQSIGEKAGVNPALGITPSTKDFVMIAAMSDMFELESSRMAENKGDAAAKTFASQMIVAHTKTSDDLKNLVSSAKIDAAIPAKLDDTHQKKIDRLTAANGADFNKMYRSDQVDAHKEAVSLFKRYADGGDNPQLKAWAAKTLPDLQNHLKMAEDLNKK